MIFRKIWFTLSYLKYLLTARSKFSVHSPYVYELYTEVILDRKARDIYKRIEKLRSSLLRQQSLLETTDFGASSNSSDYKIRFRKVREITRSSSVSPKSGKLLHRLTEICNAREILEIGTSMGISSLYISTAAPESRMVSMEGCAMIAEKAAENFKKFGANNIELVVGNFNLHLEPILKTFKHLDFVLIDGNHRKEASLEYFSMILPKMHPGSILVIDDIHWSKGMKEAWNEIKEHKKVSVTIDLFRMGIVILKEDIAKENFVLRF